MIQKQVDMQRFWEEVRKLMEDIEWIKKKREMRSISEETRRLREEAEREKMEKEMRSHREEAHRLKVEADRKKLEKESRRFREEARRLKEADGDGERAHCAEEQVLPLDRGEENAEEERNLEKVQRGTGGERTLVSTQEPELLPRAH